MVLDFTSRVRNTDPMVMFECCILCNKFGLDTVSTAGTIACAMKMYEQGIITKKDTDGLAVEWGNRKAIFTLIDKIAKREGIVDALAEGSLRFARRFVEDATKCSLNVRGLEDYAHDPRPYPALALTMVVSARGDSTQGGPSVKD